MKICLEFSSVKEMREFYDGVQFVPYGQIRKEKAAEKPKEAPAPKKAPAPAEEPAEEQITVVDVRKLLSIVNKKTGKNTAKEWIREEGFESLADVKDQETLQKLFKKAEEVINNAE